MLAKIIIKNQSVDFGPTSVLELSDEQYQPRKHNLKYLGDGIYEVLNTVQFKRGEQFGYQGEINKMLMEVVEVKTQTAKETEIPRAETESFPEKVKKVLRGRPKKK